MRLPAALLQLNGACAPLGARAEGPRLRQAAKPAKGQETTHATPRKTSHAHPGPTRSAPPSQQKSMARGPAVPVSARRLSSASARPAAKTPTHGAPSTPGAARRPPSSTLAFRKRVPGPGPPVRGSAPRFPSPAGFKPEAGRASNALLRASPSLVKGEALKMPSPRGSPVQIRPLALDADPSSFGYAPPQVKYIMSLPPLTRLGQPGVVPQARGFSHLKHGPPLPGPCSARLGPRAGICCLPAAAVSARGCPCRSPTAARAHHTLV